MHTFRIRTYIGLLTVACFGHAATASAASIDHTSTVSRFVNDDTFFVSYVDMATLPAMDNPAQLILSAVHLPQEVQEKFIGIAIIAGLIKQFQDAGGQGFYTVMSLADVNSIGGPVLVATSRAGHNPDELAQMCRDVITSIADDPNQVVLIPVAKSLVVRRVDNVVLVGTPSVVDRYESLTASPREDLTQPLANMASEDETIAAVFSPGPDFRRIFRELWPQMPPPLEKLRGELADRWLRLEFGAKVAAPPAITLTLVASDPEAANTFAQVFAALPAACEKFDEAGKKKVALQQYLQTLVAVLPVHVEGNRAVMSLPGDAGQLLKLNSLVSDATDTALESSQRRQRVQQLKELALAHFNYLDSHKLFPPPAIRDNSGRPLLSWRVAILPYLDQNDLYKQFHLDEPWDSPHNLPLVKKMPAVFADPSSRDLTAQGKTTYVAPIGRGTAFEKPEGMAIKEITDGTSKTIFLVEVAPDHAVLWTKPDDWQVDMQNPNEGLKRPDRDHFIAAFSDGHVSVIPNDVDPAQLRAILTRNGGEVVDSPY